MLRTTIGFVSLLALAGCATQSALIGTDGKRHPASVDSLAQTITAHIDGVKYHGKYVRGGGTSVGTVGYRTTTSFISSRDASAVLQSANGGVLECGFTASDFTVVGRCRSLNGTEYVLTSE